MCDVIDIFNRLEGALEEKNGKTWKMRWRQKPMTVRTLSGYNNHIVHSFSYSYSQTE